FAGCWDTRTQEDSRNCRHKRASFLPVPIRIGRGTYRTSVSDAGLMAVFQIPHRLNQRRGKSNDNGFLSSGLTVAHIICKSRFMKKLQAKITVRLSAAMLVAMTVIGPTALAMHGSTQN